jgi:hypothetical protein
MGALVVACRDEFVTMAGASAGHRKRWPAPPGAVKPVLLVSLAAFAAAQEPRLRTRAHAVVVPVSVVTKAGKPVEKSVCKRFHRSERRKTADSANDFARFRRTSDSCRYRLDNGRIVAG